MSLIAEIALGPAGLTGVAVVFGRGPGHWGDGDSLRIRLLLGSAFTALFASLVATGAQWAGARDASSVQMGAGALLAGQLYWLFILARQIPRLEPAERALFNPRLALIIRVIVLSSCICQLVVLSGFASPLARSFFLYGLLVCLSYAALGFVRFMFIRPKP